MDPKTTALIAQLRAEGLPPKAIARRLGLRPAEVSALIREQAAELQSGAGPTALSPLVASYLSPGWSTGLGLGAAAARWGELDPGSAVGQGLASVLWARAHRYGNVTVCGCLVDVYCLGVKNAIGPKNLAADELRPYVSRFFSVHDAPPVEAPFPLVQDLVLGAVEYARTLGFEPHADFAPVRPSLGDWTGPGAITFGNRGEPFFIQGPDDDPEQVLRTLRRTVGEGPFRYIQRG